MADDDLIRKYEPLWGYWNIEDFLGKGSYGSVYKVSRREFNDKYYSAVKLISVPNEEQKNEAYSSFEDEETITEYFEDIVKNIVHEIKVLNSVKGNSNIVSYEDHLVMERKDEPGWDIIIRMEYLTSLKNHMLAQSMTRGEVIKLGMDICTALEICEKKGIIHRDIKDENIFVTETWNFKLGDFGIAKELSKSGRAATARGTPLFMAPEIFKGDKYTSNADIYSLGMVLYRLLNMNRMPFMPAYPEKMRREDIDKAFERRLTGEKLPLPLNSGEKLGRILLKACEYNPAERYSNASGFKKALNDLFSELDEDFRNEKVTLIGAKSKLDSGRAKKESTDEKPELDSVDNIILPVSDAEKMAQGPDAEDTVLLSPDAEETMLLSPDAEETVLLSSDAEETVLLTPDCDETVLLHESSKEAVITPKNADETVPFPQKVDTTSTKRSKMLPVAAVSAAAVLLIIFFITRTISNNRGKSVNINDTTQTTTQSSTEPSSDLVTAATIQTEDMTSVQTDETTTAPTEAATSTEASTAEPTTPPAPTPTVKPTSTTTPKPTITPSPKPTNTLTPKPTNTPTPKPTIAPIIQSQVDLSSSYNLDGFSYDTALGDGDVDGYSFSFPADLIPDSLTYKGTQYNIGPKSNGQNNVVSATGQKITLPRGKYSELKILAVAVLNEKAGIFTVYYTDESYTETKITIADWCNQGTDTVLTMDHRHSSTDQNVMDCYFCEYTITLDSSKTVTNIKLPDESRLKIIALTLRN